MISSDKTFNRLSSSACLLLTGLSGFSSAQTAEESDWGIGIGLGSIYYPHYLGADENDLFVAPFPYIEYYGEKFRLDDDGLAAEIFESERFDLDISMSTSLPVSGDDNQSREGMDDLNLILEAGPVLEITLKNWTNSILRLDIPFRAATEIDFKTAPSYAGWTFDPKFHFETERDNKKLEFQLGALFGSENYNRIYYDVGAGDVTSDRPAYDADHGLIGWRSSLGAKVTRKNWRYFGFLRYYDLKDAANADSPLMKSDNYWSAGVGLAWMFKLPESEN